VLLGCAFRQMNPALKSFMRRNNLSDVRDLLSVYEKKYVDVDVDFYACFSVYLERRLLCVMRMRTLRHCYWSWNRPLRTSK